MTTQGLIWIAFWGAVLFLGLALAAWSELP